MLAFYKIISKIMRSYRGIAKLVRHQVLILAFVGSSPATPAIIHFVYTPFVVIIDTISVDKVA